MPLYCQYFSQCVKIRFINKTGNLSTSLKKSIIMTIKIFKNGLLILIWSLVISGCRLHSKPKSDNLSRNAGTANIVDTSSITIDAASTASGNDLSKISTLYFYDSEQKSHLQLSEEDTFDFLLGTVGGGALVAFSALLFRGKNKAAPSTPKHSALDGPEATKIEANPELSVALKQHQNTHDSGMTVSGKGGGVQVKKALLLPESTGTLDVKPMTNSNDLAFKPSELEVIVAYHPDKPLELVDGQHPPSRPSETMELRPAASTKDISMAVVKRRPVDPQRTLERLEYMEKNDVGPFLETHEDIVQYNKAKEIFQTANNRTQDILTKRIEKIEPELQKKYGSDFRSLIDRVKYHQDVLKEIKEIRERRIAINKRGGEVDSRRPVLQTEIQSETSKLSSLKAQIEALSKEIEKPVLDKVIARDKLLDEKNEVNLWTDSPKKSEKLSEIDRQLAASNRAVTEEHPKLVAEAEEFSKLEKQLAESTAKLEGLKKEASDMPTLESLKAQAEQANADSGALFKKYYEME